MIAINGSEMAVNQNTGLCEFVCDPKYCPCCYPAKPAYFKNHYKMTIQKKRGNILVFRLLAKPFRMQNLHSIIFISLKSDSNH